MLCATCTLYVVRECVAGVRGGILLGGADERLVEQAAGADGKEDRVCGSVAAARGA
jgi:hypothetical protein